MIRIQTLGPKHRTYPDPQTLNFSAESCYDPGAGHTQEEELRPLCQPPVTPMDIKLPLPR